MISYKVNFSGFEEFKVLKKNTNIIIILFIKKLFLTLYVNTLLSDFHINSDSQSYTTKSSDIKNNFKNDFKFLNFFLKNIHTGFFLKIKFIGKGFRIQSFKKKGVINFTFGHSHMYKVFMQKFFFKRLSKYKYFFKTKNIFMLNNLKINLLKIKPLNEYTLRGLRLAKYTVTKRKGRKSPNI